MYTYEPRLTHWLDCKWLAVITNILSGPRFNERRTRPASDVMQDNYEDNFGFYSVGDDPDELAFFRYIKLTSVAKVCVRCNQNVYLQPKNKICATRSTALEHGAPPSLDWYQM
jgi:hypothetical protein